MAKGKNSKTDNASGSGEKKGRTTHFLCLPLATETTVLQLASSLEYFRSVSTEPQKPKRRLEETAEGQIKVVIDDGTSRQDEAHATSTNEASTTPKEINPLGNTAKPAAQTTFAESLRILPSTAHRAPGTYHLTLGVMDLSEEVQMQRAKDLLQSLDLRQILEDAEKGPPAGTKLARDRDDRDVQETGEVEDYVSAKVESKENKPPTPDEWHGVKSLERPVSPPLMSANQQRAGDGPTSKDLPPLCVSLTGLGAFPKDKGARVIWARPREQISRCTLSQPRPTFKNNSRLDNFGLHVREIFRKEGFITETRPLVFHATVANIRYSTQAKGGRTTKGRKWAHGKTRWQEGVVDARSLLRVFNRFEGKVDEAERASAPTAGKKREESTTDEKRDNKMKEVELDDTDHELLDPRTEYIWLRDAAIDRVAICKMGATEAEDRDWGYWYPPISEKMIFDT